MPVDRSNLTGVALVLLAGILWGAMGTSVQYLFSSGAFETPLELVTLRQLCAGSLFVLVMSLVRPRAIWRLWTDRRMVIDAAVSGALLFGAHNAFFESIYYSNAGTGAILLVTVPLWCGLWSAIVNRSPVPRLEIACFLLAAAGVSLIVTDGDFSGLVFSPMAIVWGLVSSIMAAAYNIQSKRLVARAGRCARACVGSGLRRRLGVRLLQSALDFGRMDRGVRRRLRLSRSIRHDVCLLELSRGPEARLARGGGAAQQRRAACGLFLLDALSGRRARLLADRGHRACHRQRGAPGLQEELSECFVNSTS